MNSINAAGTFLYSKITALLPNTPVYNGVAPENATLPLVCFFIAESEPVKYISNLTAWEDVSVLVHVWGNSYMYDAANTITNGLDGLQGVAIGSPGSSVDAALLSSRFLGQELLASDIDDGAFGLVLKFNLRIVYYHEES